MTATVAQNWKGYQWDEATTKFNLNPDRNIKKTRTINLRLQNAANAAGEIKAKQEAMRVYFHETLEVFEQVFAPMINDEAYYARPIHKLRHPMIFYHGHTATFYINKLVLAGLTTRINPKFEEMFATGVDEMSWDDLNDAHYDWPKVSEVWEYRRLVRDRIDELFSKFTLPLPLTFASSSDSDAHTFFWAIMMGIEHERIHLETASVHVRELPMNLVQQKHPFWQPCTETGAAPDNSLVEFGGGKVREGRAMDSPGYGWDCDYGDDSQVVEVAPFKASKYIVTNQEFLEFVKDGGYKTEKYWDEEGWNWVSWKKPEHPWFWVKGSEDGDFNSYKYRTMVDHVDLPWDWPCEVNHLEATAFCNWLSEKKGKNLRLPTEAEWLSMYDETIKKDQWDWKEDEVPGNINFEHWASSCPVTKFQQGKVFDLVGNVWQHMSTPTYPYKGYRVHPLYDDFSMPTFDGRHMMMRGGTWVSTGNEATRDARFAFRRHFFQYIGIRYVEGCDINEQAKVKNCLGMDPEVDLAAQAAFSAAPEGKTFVGPVTAQLALQAFEKHGRGVNADRALDILCGGGRTSFELGVKFKESIGTDFTARMLQPAFAMRERAVASYSVVTDAATGERAAVNVAAKDFTWCADRENAFFYQSDPANLHAHLANFDLITAVNVLPRTYKPSIVPAHLVSRLNAGGILVMLEKDDKCTTCLGEQPPVAKEIPSMIQESTELVEEIEKVEVFYPTTATEGTTSVYRCLVFRKK